MIRFSAFLVLFYGLLLLPSTVSARGNPSFAPVLKEVTPAVVNISVSATSEVANNPLLNDPFFRHFFNIPEGGLPRRQNQSVGSGVVIDAQKGHVVTNHHVIDGADEIVVTLQDRRQFKAKVLGSDSGTDIALLGIDAQDLVEVAIGRSSELEVGDFVAAIGNPFGLGQTVTSGIVSALGRSGLIAEGYEDFIQTDASINPGNSGGALIDWQGNLIGINTAIIAPAGGNVGIGFAVPVDLMNGVLEQLIEYGEVRRGQLGVLIQDVTPDLAEALELKSVRGALVSQVTENSPAAEAGIQVGDVVVLVDDQEIVDGTDLRNKVGLTRAGEELEVSVVRDGEMQSFDVEVREISPERITGSDATRLLDGASFRNLESSDRLYGQVQGVYVESVYRGSRADRAGLRSGDIIMSVNRRLSRNLEEFGALIVGNDRALALHVQRGMSRIFVVVR